MTDTRASSSLDEAAFIQGYTRCLIWSENDEADESGGEPIDANHSVDDIPNEDQLEITRDCLAFIAANRPLLEDAVKRDGYSSARAGHDFWLNRQGHGTGYWDRTELEDETTPSLGDQLSDACIAFGEHHQGPWVEAGLVRYGLSTQILAGKVARSQADSAADAAIKETLGEAMDCTRVWEAWSYNTMDENDFVLVNEDTDRVHDIAQAAVGAALAQPTGTEREDVLVAMGEAIAGELGDAAYECTASWNDWRDGTMTSDSFRLLAEQEDWVSSMATATLDKIQPFLAVIQKPAAVVPAHLMPDMGATISVEEIETLVEKTPNRRPRPR